MSEKRWYRCGTGATGCPKAESGAAFCVKEDEYDSWKCPHSKFCKDSLIRVSWIERHRRWVTTLLFLLLLLLAAGILWFYLSQSKPPVSVVQAPVTEPEPAEVHQPEQPTVQTHEDKQPEIKESNDSERIDQKLREALKPSIPQALNPLPKQKFYFDKNKSRLDAKLRPYLTEAVKELSKPEYQGKHIAVVGFADAQGTDKTNCPLSEARADTIAQELLKLSTRTVAPLGLCSTRPIGDNSTPEGQQMNRRVELWLFDLQ
ncbi:MAG: OmpA family protein [Methylococcaceae bacterium]